MDALMNAGRMEDPLSAFFDLYNQIDVKNEYMARSHQPMRQTMCKKLIKNRVDSVAMRPCHCKFSAFNNTSSLIKYQNHISHGICLIFLFSLLQYIIVHFFCLKIYPRVNLSRHLNPDK